MDEKKPPTLEEALAAMEKISEHLRVISAYGAADPDKVTSFLTIIAVNKGEAAHCAYEVQGTGTALGNLISVYAREDTDLKAILSHALLHAN